METFVLENGNLRLEFNRANGTLVGLRAGADLHGWQILDRPQLGLSFRLLVPLSEEKRNNPVFVVKNNRFPSLKLALITARRFSIGMR